MPTTPAKLGAAALQPWQRFLASMLLGGTLAVAEERHAALQGLRSTTAAPLALPPLLGLEEEEEEEEEEVEKEKARVMETDKDHCEALHDNHGQWKGSRRPGESYHLFCRPGYAATNNWGREKDERKISCRRYEDGVPAWPEKPSCYNIDECDGLKFGCGAFGMCTDDVNGTTCNCEKGRERKKHGRETICGDVTSCGGNSCGAYGVCVDQGKDAWKCECAHGFHYDNKKKICTRSHCTRLTNVSGTWSGSTKYGERYTLTCDDQSFVRGHEGLKTITISCGWNGMIADWPEPVPTCENLDREAEEAAAESRKRLLFFFGVLCCVTCAALAAGLTLGVAGLQPFSLKVIIATEPDDYKDKQERRKLQSEQQSAREVLPLVQDHHRLLITLMMFNTLANEALPICLEELVPSWAAVLISVSLVLIFCEVIPSAIFTGPSQLQIAGFFAPLVKKLEWVLHYPSMPIIKLLQWITPHEDHEGDVKYTRAELRAIIRQQGDNLDAATRVVEDDHNSSPHLGGSEVLTWLLGAGHHSQSNNGLSNPVLTDNPTAAGTEETPTAQILSRAELQQINGALNLHHVPLNQVEFTKRRQCLIAGGHENPLDVLSRLHSGCRVVLLLHEEVQQRSGYVTAAMVHRILWPADLLTGEAALGDIRCGMPVQLPEDINVLEALKKLQRESSSSGLVLASGEDGAAVKGAVRAQDLLAEVLKAKEQETITQPVVGEEDRFARVRIPAQERIHRGVSFMTQRTAGLSLQGTHPQTMSTPRATSLEARGHYRPLTTP